VLELTKLGKSIIFKFDHQKILPVSPHQAKQNFCSLREGTMTNAKCLEFNNHIDIASSYDGEMLNASVLECTRNKLHPGADPGDQNEAELATVCMTAKELWQFA
jgi:hypothetical protein